jgi:hypothetical protein
MLRGLEPTKGNFVARKQRYTAQQVIDALQTTKGMVFLAAKRLQCAPETVVNYCRRYPSVEAAKQDARGELLDVAEIKLWQAVQRDDAWAIAFALRTLGRGRGYVERLDLHLTIERAAARVAGQFGITVEEVLTEAKLLLEEIDRGEQ